MTDKDLCEGCGRVDARLVAGLCTVCSAKQTPLTRERLLAVLANHVGINRGASIGRLVDEMVGHRHMSAAEHACAERDVRELVVQLRLEGHHVCASPTTGYYLAANLDELNAACEFLTTRAMTSLLQVSRMKRVSVPDLVGQMHLPT